MMLGEKLYDICQPLFRSVSRVWCFEMLLWSWYIHATQNKNYQDHLMASKQQLRRCCAATSKLRIWVPLGQWVFCQLRRPRLMGCLGDAWDAHGMRPLPPNLDYLGFQACNEAQQPCDAKTHWAITWNHLFILFRDPSHPQHTWPPSCAVYEHLWVNNWLITFSHSLKRIEKQIRLLSF